MGDVNGDFHFAKRKLTGTWVNSPMFIQAWKAIRTEGVWASHDWTVKVDADAVFLPMRLRTKLSSQKVTSSGIYLENCKYVNFGFFGNLEVISHQGFSTFLANIEDCTKALNWKGKDKDTGTEAWGEDLFMQRCMDLHGVDKVSLGPYHRLNVQSFQARGPEEEREVETELRIDSDSGHAPVHEAVRILRVLEGHSAMRARDCLLELRGLSILGTTGLDLGGCSQREPCGRRNHLWWIVNSWCSKK